MTLGFLLYFDKAKKVPTHFPEKILTALDNGLAFHVHAFCEQFPEYPVYVFSDIVEQNGKLHTIRNDDKDRWCAGRDIHFVVGNRSPRRYQFAPVVKCVSVQPVFMSYDERNGLEISINGKYHYWRSSDLWRNDGFDSCEAFEEYFIKECKKDKAHQCISGKIIHWTNLKY